MLPAQQGEVGEQGIRDQITATAGGVQRSAGVDCVPQHDGSRDQGQAAGTVLLILSGAVVQPSQAVEAQRVRLDEGFWASLREHPVPIREEAIRAIGSRSMAMDVYIWLAYRLHALVKSTSITWAAIQGQFGAGYRSGRNLRPVFLDALQIALAVYPEARIDIDEGRGVILQPSPPAVPRSTAKRLNIS